MLHEGLVDDQDGIAMPSLDVVSPSGHEVGVRYGQRRHPGVEGVARGAFVARASGAEQLVGQVLNGLQCNETGWEPEPKITFTGLGVCLKQDRRVELPHLLVRLGLLGVALRVDDRGHAEGDEQDDNPDDDKQFGECERGLGVTL